MIQWTAEQFERYKLLEHHLRPAHAQAAQALITLARLHPGQRQYERSPARRRAPAAELALEPMPPCPAKRAPSVTKMVPAKPRSLSS